MDDELRDKLGADIHELRKEGLTFREIGEKLNKTTAQIQGSYNRYKKKGLLPAAGEKKFDASVMLHEDGSITSHKLIRIVKANLKKPRELIKAHGYDPDKWEIASAISNFWQGMKAVDFGGGALTLYQSKITIRPTAGKFNSESIDKLFKNYKPSVKAPPRKVIKRKGSGILVEPVITDLHHGNIPQDGSPNTAIQDLADHTADTIEHIANMINPPDKIVIASLGDLNHYDTKSKTSTKGTQLESNMTEEEMITGTFNAMVHTIGAYSEIAPVEILAVPGNHDYLTTYIMFMAVKAFFKDDKNITFDVTNNKHKWFQWGVSLIGITHGDMPKKRLQTLLHTLAKKAMSSTTYTEQQVGDKHHVYQIEDSGVALQGYPSMAKLDLWHYDNGWLGSKRAAFTRVFHKERGPIDTFQFYLDM